MGNQANLTVVKTSDVLELLKQGKKRKEINEMYGLNANSAKALWSSASLKRKKVAGQGREVTISVVDDLAEGTAPVATAAPVAEITEAPAVVEAPVAQEAAAESWGQ